MMSTRRQRPTLIQSSAMPTAMVVEAAGRVDLGVGTADAEQFGKLRVTHGKDTEEETAIELVAAAAGSLGKETRDLVHQVVVAREGRGEDHAGFIGHGDRKPPAVGKKLPWWYGDSGAPAECPRRAGPRCPRQWPAQS